MLQLFGSRLNSLFHGVYENLQLVGILPEAEAAFDGVAVGAKDDVWRKVLHELGVAAAEQNVVADEGDLKAADDVEDRLAPTLFAAKMKTGGTDVLLVGTAFFIGQVGELKGDYDAIEDHGRAKPGACAEEEHASAAVASESLHGCVVDETDGLAEDFLVGKVDPSCGEVVWLGEWVVVDDGARVTD